MQMLQVYARVLGLLRPEWRRCAVMLPCGLAIAGIGFLEPVLFGWVVDLLFRASGLTSGQLWAEAASLLGLWAMVGLTGIAAGMAVALMADRMAHRARMREMGHFFSHALTLPAAFHGRVHSGALMRILTTGTESLFQLWLGFFRDHFTGFISLLVLLPMTMALNWRLSLALVALVLLFGGLTALVIGRTQDLQQGAEACHTRLAATAQDAFANIAVVQAFTRLAAERHSFAALQGEALSRQYPVLNWWALLSILTRSASTLAILAIVVFGTWLHLNGQASVGDIVSFMGFAALLIGRLEQMVWFVSKLFAQAPVLAEFFAVLDAGSAVPEATGAMTLAPGAGEVMFEDVSFAYPNGAAILSAVSFTARPGQVVALVGATGAGKSTAMSLLQRGWDPTAGRILIDGQDLRSLRLDSLRGAIGVVFQDSLLFNRSIRENLLVGRPDATEAEIEQACRLAEAHDFILRQPQGYDTLIGERGGTLSGGQKQRLAIARALLKNPPILILDEATSALDAATELKVTRALKALMAGRTTFVIAHRLSTIRDADEILVFEGGRIAERGAFEALASAGGVFAGLVESQMAPTMTTVVPLPRAA
ncbi:glucan ABC transporter ATP-binding protein/ permease [Pseudoroseomonas globiformis]|uniref:Glucan ABC transporter ATP-binding protein/ permease n=1 Tax=Teichococcus globiformis TaxID=2307229 RepID=A0ABV7G4F8_9PROT